MTGFTDEDVPDQTGRCFLVTGANAGIGFEISRVLARKGARVLLGCRDTTKAAAAVAGIRSETPGADLQVLPIDLGDLDSIARAAEQATREPRLDVLINNAGIMDPPLERTRQGFEPQFGVNHLGPFALTTRLLPKLAEEPEARIVITASIAHRRGRIDWDDLDARRSYDRKQRYADSKLANLLHLYELDRRLRAANSTVSAVGCHPGIAATELVRHLNGASVIGPLLGLVLNTAAQGAWPALQAATAPVIQPGGYYGPRSFGGTRGKSAPATRAACACDQAVAHRLWDVSIAKTGLDPKLSAS